MAFLRLTARQTVENHLIAILRYQVVVKTVNHTFHHVQTAYQVLFTGTIDIVHDYFCSIVFT